MSGHEPSSLKDKIVSTCFGLLAATIALYVAVGLIEAIWPWLVGIGGAVVLVWGGVVALRVWRERG